MHARLVPSLLLSAVALLPLPALAQKQQVLPAQQRVLDRGDHRVLVADDAGKERFAGAKLAKQVDANFFANAAREMRLLL